MHLLNSKMRRLSQTVLTALQQHPAMQTQPHWPKAETRFTQNPMSGPELSVPFTPRSGMVGQSGVVVRETAELGVLLQRHMGSDREFVMELRGTQTKLDWLSNLNVGMTRWCIRPLHQSMSQ